MAGPPSPLHATLHPRGPALEQSRAAASARTRAPAPAVAASHCGNIHEQEEEASAPGAADLYAVLGLNRECTDAELRVAYRRLAMIWHPDKCSASGSSARVEEAKERFQEIQGAYSVLSDSNKRLLYDVGVYDSDDDEADLSGMGDFLGEMADMMSQATPTETFEELQQVFVDMFQDDLDDAGFFGGLPTTGRRARQAPASTSVPPSVSPLRPTPAAGRSKGAQAPSSASSFKGVETWGSTAKRPRPGSAGLEPDLGLSGFCFMSKERQAAWASDEGDKRSGNKQRLSTSRDVSGGGMPRSQQGQSSRNLWQCMASS